MIGQTISHYRILEKLGGGGMGVVYKAQDLKLDRPVALKFLPPESTRDPEAKARFIHEAKAASALQHNNICVVYDIDEASEGELFICMEHLDGETLKQRIANGQLSIDNCVDYASQVAQGLAKAHESGIIHRDIKPANMMLTTDGVAKIVDFGLAKLSGRTLLTKSGTTLGTAAYMSPEQARGEQVDHRSDIWSLGVVLYEMSTGRRPFESEYEQALVYSILSEEPKAIRDLRPDVPEAIEKICRRAMAKDAKDRYQTASELLADLESYKAGTQLSRQTRKVQNKKRGLLYAGLAVVIVAIVIGGIYYSTMKGEIFDRVAVLPFENRLKDSTGEMLAAFIPEGITNGLHRVASLKVPSYKSALKFKGSNADYVQIARELGAKVLVHGSVAYLNNRVRVIVRLIDPAKDNEIWSESYDRAREDILDLESTIAQDVVRQVRVNVPQDEQGRLGRSQKTVNPQAYELYLKARQDIWLQDVNPLKSNWEGVMARLQKAIDIEPDNAIYYASLAMGYLDAIGWSFVSSAEVLPKMKAAAEEALRLDPDLPESHVASATADMWQYDFKSALLRSARLLELSPGSSEAHLVRGMICKALGRFEEALVMYRRAQEIDPEQFKPAEYNIGMCYIFMRRYDDAIALYQQMLRQNPKSDLGHTFLAVALSFKGMHAEALAHNDSAQYWGITNRPLFLARAGKRALAIKAYEKGRSSPNFNDYTKAVFFALIGEKDSAFYWLDRFYRDPSGELTWIRHDPFLDNLRDDPRFKELLKKMNLLD